MGIIWIDLQMGMGKVSGDNFTGPVTNATLGFC